MLIAVAKETRSKENRVALTPAFVANFTALGYQVKIEHNAGLASGFRDEEYRQAGAEICAAPKQTFRQADIILKIWAPEENEISNFCANQTIVCNTRNIRTFEQLKNFSTARVNLCALDLMPRTSRAQNMDILSSQNNLAGYAATITGASKSPTVMPLLITSAGTLPPLKVLIIGLGVAGLQAAATAHRLGAQVYAYDTRAETEEQAASLGVTFVKELSADILSSVRLIITSAQSFGKPAPEVLKAKQYAKLSSDCIIIDMAADDGGNINPQKLPSSITLIADSHLERQIPYSASTLFAGNVYQFCQFLIKDNDLYFNFNDDIISAVSICYHGQIRHPYLSEAKYHGV